MQHNEEAGGFTRTSFFCQRCPEHTELTYFDPTERAPETFRAYWDKTKTPYTERVLEWHSRVIRYKELEDRKIERRLSYKYDDEGNLVIKQ